MIQRAKGLFSNGKWEINAVFMGAVARVMPEVSCFRKGAGDSDPVNLAFKKTKRKTVESLLEKDDAECSICFIAALECFLLLNALKLSRAHVWSINFLLLGGYLLESAALK